ncbi:DUF1127 domain-containing protein [Labrenzia sp. PHM005]|uniref:DUF1127 domain-containing protein n=1 Tax=Stappiaceae TaxID=2821832 RepID=UPI0011404528|nr:DUF1127 domain-containing protein [Labrenzia sp. PHM005]QDG76926.1 DUF1127 domain-containing protein [Labrenzia sp. PHM005]
MSAIESISAVHCPAPAGKAAPRSTFVQKVLGWMLTARSRGHLAELTDAQLKDIGLTPAEVRKEVEKPFWQGPRFR